MRSSKPENIYKVGGYIKGETEKAILIKLVTIDGCDAEPSQQKDHWFPLSQTVSITKSAPGSEELDEIKVKEWILRQKELV